MELTLAATFTIEPVERPLRFWVERLGLPLDVRLAPHAQILQQLLDPGSCLTHSGKGVNVLFLRPEDAARDLPPSLRPADYRLHVENTTREWARAIAAFRSRAAASLIVVIPGEAGSDSKLDPAELAAIRDQLAQAVQKIPDVVLLQHCDIQNLYPVDACTDGLADELAHVPFTTEYFVAMATLLVRKVTRLIAPPYKVIVLDCDNTLWEGICGELSPQELMLSPDHIAFQRRLIDLQAQGMILCLCSKNNLEDVQAVFAARMDMPLRFDHILAYRINWAAKSTNLISLATELRLGLDAFIFVDDNPAECSAVMSACPEVLTLQIPTDAQGLRNFLRHTWAFDVSAGTADAGKRTLFYRQNRLREAAMAAAPDFATFLAGLNLNVGIVPLCPEHLERAAELVVRTNQFNLTTIRRLPGEIASLTCDARYHPMVISVSDRFGEYGVTGLVFLLINGINAEVDTFILSCRVLGRGVEASVVNYLAHWATEHNVDHLQFRYIPTRRNAPALQFLSKAFADFEIHTDIGRLYKVPVSYAKSLRSSQHMDFPGSADLPVTTGTAPSETATHRCYPVTQSLTRVTDIMNEMFEYRVRGTAAAQLETRQTGEAGAESQRPRGFVEESLAQLWKEVLGRAPTDRNAGFIESGGDSVTAVTLTSKIARRLGVRPSLAAVTRCRSLAAQAELVTALRPSSIIDAELQVEEGSI